MDPGQTRTRRLHLVMMVVMFTMKPLSKWNMILSHWNGMNNMWSMMVSCPMRIGTIFQLLLLVVFFMRVIGVILNRLLVMDHGCTKVCMGRPASPQIV